MIRTGLVSVTFRSLAPREIVNLVRQAGQEGIEWGGDIHVPHGNVEIAREVAAMTQDAGLQVAAYGSYYKVGISSQAGLAFEAVLDTALALQAPTIRVWAGNQGSEQADAQTYAAIVADAQRIADLARTAGVTVSFEFHRGTLTDTAEAAVKLYQEIGRDNLRLYWQEPLEVEEPNRLPGLRAVLPYLSNVHVYHWAVNGAEHQPRPLAEGRTLWEEYLRVLAGDGRDHVALLEFVKGNAPEQYLADAATLKEWMAAMARP